MTVRAIPFVYLLACLVAGCSSNESTASGGSCTTTQQCPMGKLCDVLNGACVPEPVAGALGFFECTATNGVIGRSEVTGNLNGVHYDLTTTTTCVANSSFVSVSAISQDATGAEIATLTINVSMSSVAAGQVIALSDNTASQPLAAIGSGTLWKGQLTPETLALVSGGKIRFDQVPAANATFSGFLDVGLRLPGSSPGSCSDGTSGHTSCDPCISDAQAPSGCCGSQEAACTANASCTGLAACITACPDSPCVSSCTDQYPDGAQPLLALLDCTLGDSTSGSLGACGSVCQ